MKMRFEEYMEIEMRKAKKELEDLFELAEQDTPEGEKAREHIDKVCYDYTHR